ncbi:unnamed protein product [marine sediment metagenome]|uniref:Uncharacterized protein n=1 Tax=marine sediment metagenome TaxID=412755 RepID=X1GTH6_9ZZZZ
MKKNEIGDNVRRIEVDSPHYPNRVPIPDPIDQRKYASDGIKNKHANWKAQSCDKIEDNAP